MAANGVQTDGSKRQDNVSSCRRDTIAAPAQAQELLRGPEYGDAARLMDKILGEVGRLCLPAAERTQPITQLKAEAQR